jgi:acyl-[acyl-carrier-protein]-phospholipid O-acyltransferase/long-chain-fatty-acid--[acyl-carrier-protein] ligase
VLSHRNILANCAQLSSVIDFHGGDIVFNAMPMFHSFGLTGGTILPLVSGVRTFHYPSPLHYRIIPV